MNSEPSTLTLFNNALDISDPAARERYLQEACAEDAAQYKRVEKLLRAHWEAGGFLADPLNSDERDQEEAAKVLPGIEKAGDTIGRYRLLEQLGEGGCGVVYMAEQQEPVRRRVALKVIKLGMDTRQVVARFEAERQALALMDHPNIARVLDAGATESGRPFFVMELVRGQRITEFCDRRKLSTSERLGLFIQVCKSVQHAHQKGIIHRDLKPSNILVTMIDGAPVPKVIDFGIAKATDNQPLGNKTLFTAFEQFIGTPAYMSPEQAELSGADIDTRTDIYSLGVVLYELLTGKTPFDSEALLRAGFDEIRRTIREQEPRRPSTRLRALPRADLTTTAEARQTDAPKLVHVVRGDLDWIVMKCLEKDRRRRYETANGVASDIKRHLACEPVVARPPSRLYEFQKTVRRHKVGFAATGAVIVALTAGLAVSLWTLRMEQESRERAVGAEQEGRRQLYAALLGQARATVRSGELGQRVRALDAIRRAAAITNTAELRREVFAALALPDLRFERDLPKSRDVTMAQLDPAFGRLALGRGRAPVEIVSASDGHLISSLPASLNLPVHFALWSPDGRFLAVKLDREASGHSAILEVWHMGSGDPERVLLLHDVRWEGFSFHPRRPQIIIGREGGVAGIWDLVSRAEVARFKMPAEALELEFSPDGERFSGIYQGGDHLTLSVHDTGNGTILTSRRFDGVTGRGNLSWHPHGRWIAAVDDTGNVSVMDSHTGESHGLGQHKSAAVTAVFSPDGGYLFTGSWDRDLICWDVRRMREAFTIALEGFRVQFDETGEKCAVFTQEGAIKLHAFERPNGQEFPEELGTRLRYAAFSPDGRWLAAAGMRRGGLWDLSNPNFAATDDEAYEARFFFTADGSELFGSRNAGNDLQGLRWKFAPATNSSSLPGWTRLPLHQPESFSYMARYSNSIVMTGARGSQTLAPEELERGNDQWTRTASGISGVSGDGRWLAIYQPYTADLHIYRMPGLEVAANLRQAAAIMDFQFSPSGEEVAVGSRSGVEFWSTSTWERLRVATNFVRIIYSPHGRSYWLTKDVFTGGLYEARTLEPLLLLPSGMLPLALSTDGKQLAVSVDARRLQVWDLREIRRQLRDMGLDWDDQGRGLKLN